MTIPSSSSLAGIEDRIEEIRKRDSIPALGIAATKDGAPALVKSFGEASVPFGVRATEKTLFHMGSVGKHVTAAAVLKLVEVGKVDVARDIGTYVDGLPQSWRARSVRSLLTHTSGIPDYESFVEWDRAYTRDEVIKLVSSLSPDFDEGASWTYSNTNYLLLGWLIADVGGRSYRQFLTDELLTPAHLRDARPDSAESVIPNRAQPYEVTPDGLRHAVRMESELSAWGDGGVLMSPRDAVPWDASLDRGPALSDAGRAAMFSPARLSTGRRFPYGYGWFLDSLGQGRELYSHGGAVPGFTTIYLKCPAERVSVLVLGNKDEADGAQTKIAQLIAEQLAPGSTPSSLRPIRDAHRDMTQAARAILYRGKRPLDLSRFAPEIVILTKGRDGGRAVRRAVPNLGRLGEPDSFELVQDHQWFGSQVRRYRATHGDRSRQVSMAYTPEGLIHWVQSF